MADQTNGEVQSSSALPIQTKLDKSQAALDQFERDIGFPDFAPAEIENETTRILQITPQEFSKMSHEEKTNAAFTLFQFALYLQRTINTETSKITWAKAYLNKTIGCQAAYKKAYSQEERMLLAISENDAAKNADTIRIQAQLKVDRLSFLNDKIRNMGLALLGRKD